MPTTAARVSSFGTTIFSEINDLALQHRAINLGQGRPDFDGPADIIMAEVNALNSGQHNQYPPGIGIRSMRQAVAAHAARFYGLEVDPEAGVIITAGATEAIFSSILGLVDPGDEVIVIEPYFDSYVPNIVMANAVPVYVPLRPPDWTFDPDELRRAFTPRTRALLLNTPHNPTGRVFSREELLTIAALCQQHDVTVISDEVYEHLVFDDARHIPMATLPGMFERTVTVSSLGKTFSVTGWKVGWVFGPSALLAGVGRAHQFVTFCAHHPAQVAGAYALNLPGTYYEEFQTMYAAKRDRLLRGLSAAGLKTRAPEGTYFVLADFSEVFDGDDLAFTHHLITEIGVACIPTSPFFSPQHRSLAATQVRFTFCKTDEMLEEAASRLARLGH